MVSEKIETVRERERENLKYSESCLRQNFNQRTQCVRERVGWESSAVFISEVILLCALVVVHFGQVLGFMLTCLSDVQCSRAS